MFPATVEETQGRSQIFELGKEWIIKGIKKAKSKIGEDLVFVIADVREEHGKSVVVSQHGEEEKDKMILESDRFGTIPVTSYSVLRGPFAKVIKKTNPKGAKVLKEKAPKGYTYVAIIAYRGVGLAII